MSNNAIHQTRWNIFARELEDILQERGLRLSHLEHRKVVRHKEKVRRLQHSLHSPKHLTTLNPDEIETLITVMQLTDVEQRRLQAALMATAVEMVLMDRIAPEVALMAADDVYSILFTAMKAQPDLIITTHVKAGALLDNEEAILDTHFSQALDMLDRATLALHASKQASTPQAHIIHAHEALSAFTRTIELLKLSNASTQEGQSWLDWYNEAVEGQKMSHQLLQAAQEKEL